MSLKITKIQFFVKFSKLRLKLYFSISSRHSTLALNSPSQVSLNHYYAHEYHEYSAQNSENLKIKIVELSDVLERFDFYLWESGGSGFLNKIEVPGRKSFQIKIIIRFEFRGSARIRFQIYIDFISRKASRYRFLQFFSNFAVDLFFHQVFILQDHFLTVTNGVGWQWCWWQNFDVGDIFFILPIILVLDANVKR